MKKLRIIAGVLILLISSSFSSAVVKKGKLVLQGDLFIKGFLLGKRAEINMYVHSDKNTIKSITIQGYINFFLNSKSVVRIKDLKQESPNELFIKRFKKHFFFTFSKDFSAKKGGFLYLQVNIKNDSVDFIKRDTFLIRPGFRRALV